MSNVSRFIPLLVVTAIVILFVSMMGGDRNPQEVKSVLVGKPAPSFSLPLLTGGEGMLTEAELKTGKPVLVNFFASWCLPCRAEHENLMRLAKEMELPIIGIAYKDDPEKSQRFLDELGDPFTKSASDIDGRVAIDWGVTGVPESFLVDGDGVVRYRHWGPIVGEGLVRRLLPKLREIQ